MLALAGLLAGTDAAAQAVTRTKTPPKARPVVGWIENALIDPGGLLIRTPRGELEAGAVIACAGLWADRVAEQTGDAGADDA